MIGLKPKTATKLDLVPVLFANGQDDDTLGFIAAIIAKRVLFDEHVYACDEDIVVAGRVLLLPKPMWLIGDYDPSSAPDVDDFIVVRCDNGNVRHLTVKNCNIRCPRFRIDDKIDAHPR